MPDASPAKWHLAHTTWFFETFILSARVPGLSAFRSAIQTAFQLLLQAIGIASAARLARIDVAPQSGRGARISRLGGRRHAAFSRTRGCRRECGGADRAGTESRATASGADPHRHETCAVVDAAAPETSEPAARGEQCCAAGMDRLRRAVFTRSATLATVSLSTTKARGMRSCCGRSNWRRAWSLTANIWNSCSDRWLSEARAVALRRLGRGLRAEAGMRRCTGSAMKADPERGRSLRLPGCRKLILPRPFAT